MARGASIKVLRTTRANLNTQAAANGLIAGEPYLITDEGRIAVALTTSTYKALGSTYGSNANGSWARHEDGTQECWFAASATISIDTAYFGGYRSGGQTWTYPNTFSATPVVLFTAATGSSHGGVALPGSSSANFVWTSVDSQPSAARTGSLYARGLYT